MELTLGIYDKFFHLFILYKKGLFCAKELPYPAKLATHSATLAHQYHVPY